MDADILQEKKVVSVNVWTCPMSLTLNPLPSSLPCLCVRMSVFAYVVCACMEPKPYVPKACGRNIVATQ